MKFLSPSRIYGILLVCAFLPNVVLAEEGILIGDTTGNKIEAAFLDGSNRHNLILNTPGVEAIAIDRIRGKLFWSENPGNARRLRAANLDGSNAVTIASALSGNDFIFGIAVDSVSQKIYWTEYNSHCVRVVSYDGTNISTLLSSGIDGPVGIDVDAVDGKLYVAEADSNEISSADLDGNNLNVIYSGTPTGPLQLILDKTVSPKQLYYVLFTSLNRVNIDGTSPIPVIESGLSIVSALAIDFQTRKAYLGDIGSHEIYSVDLDGNNFSTSVSSTLSVFGLAFAEVSASTPTPTSTPTPSPTATSTFTSTPTPIASPDATPPMTATVTATPISTVTPTIIPTISPTQAPTVSVGTGNISGTLLAANGAPIARALVTLYDTLNQEENAAIGIKAKDHAIKTTSTDVYGVYRFSNLSSGQFRLEPKLDGLSFDPPFLMANSGEQAATSYAAPTMLPDTRCSVKNVVVDLTKFGDSAESLLTATTQAAAQVIKILEKDKSTSSKIRLLAKLAKIQNDCKSIYFSTLELSSDLPLLIRSCPKNLSCKIRPYTSILDRLRGKLKQIVRRGDEIINIANDSSRHGTRVPVFSLRRVYGRYATAIKITGRLPTQNMDCAL